MYTSSEDEEFETQNKEIRQKSKEQKKLTYNRWLEKTN